MPIVARISWAHRVEFVTTPLLVAGGAWLTWPIDARDVAIGALAFAVGWPLFEWWLHRELLHRWLRRAHWIHHVEPLGDTHILPLVPDALLLVTLGIMTAVFGRQTGAAVFVGFGSGYATYYYGHWCMHVGWWPDGGWLGEARSRHAVHHQGVEANYNVLVPLGDWMFGTYLRADDSRSNRRGRKRPVHDTPL